jgi:hypothetical protein
VNVLVFHHLQTARITAPRSTPSSLINHPKRKSLIWTGVLSELLLAGVQSQQQVARLMAGADMLFLPSAYEGIALVCYEAMSAGLPIVCSDVGGQTELVTPECGIAIKPGPGERLAYIHALTTLINDSEWRLRMGTAARQRVEEHFRLEDMGKRIATLIDKAIHLRRTAPRSVLAAEEGKACLLKYFAEANHGALVSRLWGGSRRSGNRGNQNGRIQKEGIIDALRGYMRRKFEQMLIARKVSILRIE